MKNKIKIFVDGSSAGNPGRGGWAVVILKDWKLNHILKGNQSKATNSQMELKALLEALKFLVKNNIDWAQIYSDSSYVVNGATKWLNGWILKNGKKANGDAVAHWQTWQDIAQLLSQIQNLQISWVRWHAGNQFNELADKVAQQQAFEKN